jgi:hypothetical protein
MQPITGYRIRPVSFAGSIALHALAIGGLLLLPSFEVQTPKRPVYEELVKPAERRIIWYTAPKRLPDVNARKRIGTFLKPRAREQAELAIIATSPNPKSAKQFIWQPIPKVEIRQDLSTPNLIARAAMAIPQPPPPPEPKPKVARPDIAGVEAPQPNLSPPAPNGDVNRARETQEQPIEIPKPRRVFVPPPPSQKPTRLPIPVQTVDVPIPDVSIVGAAGVRTGLPEGLGAPVISKGSPPPSNGPAGPATLSGEGNVNIAVASLHPGDKRGPTPEGSRPGEFSQAPTVGEVATGVVRGDLSIPNLTVRESKPAEAPRVNANRKTILYADRLRSLSVSTLSVPLRPASRTIPRAIDARFQGRFVYTMVVPIENFPPYSGDWILWFAERESKPGDTPFVRAPVPLRKFETVEPVLPGARTELRVQFAAMINREGKIGNISFLGTINPVLGQAVTQDLSAWEFKPATRDGNPVDVDVVLEIPFSLPPPIAKATQP